MSETRRRGNAAAAAAPQAPVKVGIPMSEAFTGAQLQWNYHDLVGADWKINEVTIGETKKGKKCFVIELDGRKEPMKMMASQALDYGIAVQEDDQVVIDAEEIAVDSVDGAIEVKKVS